MRIQEHTPTSFTGPSSASTRAKAHSFLIVLGCLLVSVLATAFAALDVAFGWGLM